MSTYGSSRMKWFFTKPYVRHSPSLLHYPLTSHVNRGKLINWMYNKPYDRSEVIAVYGPNTIQLTNLPMGYTPEYLQERLRRFFSKFGTVTFVRCLPHELDPYQCNGTGYVSFRTKESSLDASRANLVLPFTLHSKIISINHLYWDTHNDPQYYYKQLHYNREILRIGLELYRKIADQGVISINRVANGIFEKCFYTGKLIKSGVSVLSKFGTWDNFFNQSPFKRIFKVVEGRIGLLLCSEETLERVLKEAEIQLTKQLDESLTVNWRLGKPKLPEQAQKEANELYHLEPIPEQLQLLSRSHTMYRLHDERYLFKFSLKQKRNQQRKLYRQNKLNTQSTT